MTGQYAIEITSLHVSLRSCAVIRGVDLAVDRGDFVAIVGPNGAGKTTLLRAIAGLVDSSGHIVVDGRPVGRRSSRERARRITYVPQHPVIPPSMAVEDYVLLGRTPHLGRFAVDTAADRAIVAGALERLDLMPWRSRPVGELSGGERQRATLARAVAQQSPILLLDEPTSALDLGHQHGVLEWIDALRRERGVTVIASIHDLSLASEYANRLVLLANGRVVGDGGPADVVTVEALARYWHAHVDVFVDERGAVHIFRRPRSTKVLGSRNG